MKTNLNIVVWPLVLCFGLAAGGCSRTPKPDLYPPGTHVTLATKGIYGVFQETFQLGPRSSQLFLNMLTNQPVHSEISEMPAEPMGAFKVGDVEYLWHGNGVIRGTGSSERLWHGPYLQRLIIEVMKEQKHTRQSVQQILDTLEKDPTVEATALQGPGQYPGGANDALHPARGFDPSDTNIWHVFKPDANKR